MMRLVQIVILIAGQLLGLSAFAAWALATGLGIRTAAVAVALAALLIAVAVAPPAEDAEAALGRRT